MVNKSWRFVALAFASGFIGLGQEIAWVRIFSFMAKSVPQAFSFVLLFYVIGIAIGARLAMRLVDRGNPDRQVALLLAGSGTLICAAPFLLSQFAHNSSVAWVFAILIFVPALLKGAIFPLVHHYFSTLGERLGRTLSLVYFCNVIGSALGPLLVGFVLLDMFSAYVVLYILGLFELLLACIFLFRAARVPATVFALVLVPLLFGTYRAAEGAMFKSIADEYSDGKITNLIENRYGVIHTEHRHRLGVDRVYGGNVYDGMFNANITKEFNGIDRVYLLAGLQTNAEKIVVIGLSSASWLKVIEAFPAAKSIDVIEINPGYVELAKRYSGFSNYLSDPRVRVHFTDGRKWLTREVAAGNRFDLVVMNTTWHWRSYSANLLSVDFMKVLMASLNDDGLAAFNATGSIDSFYTASQVFPHSWLYSNFVYGSPRDLRSTMTKAVATERICAVDFSRIGTAGCEDEQVAQAVEKMLTVRRMRTWEEYEALRTLPRAPELITDNNMLPEYKYGRSVFDF